MEEWGFRYVTMITWAKDRFGLGQYFRGMTEHCLFGVKGKLPYKIVDGKRQQGTTLINAKRTIFPWFLSTSLNLLLNQSSKIACQVLCLCVY